MTVATSSPGFAHGAPSVAVAHPSPEELFTQHVRFVWRSLRHFGVREADLEDQTHEVFLVAYRRFAELRIVHTRAWLYAIARRRAAAYRRTAQHRRELLVEELPDSVAPAETGTQMELDRLDRLLASLDADKRAVFVLFELEDMSMQEVAQAVGCPIQTAYSRLYAARRELAQKLAEER